MMDEYIYDEEGYLDRTKNKVLDQSEMIKKLNKQEKENKEKMMDIMGYTKEDDLRERKMMIRMGF